MSLNQPAGADGVVASFGTEPGRAVDSMRDFAERFRSRFDG